ncbi:MAG: glycosyltransferase family 39 protein [Candidatus Anammoxibacter sp.]
MDITNNKYLPYILFAICLITRLLFFGIYIDDWDGVNFAFALSDKYDVLHDQPHFHGYPVYMFVSWIIYNICHSDINALILSGIIFSSLAVIPFYALVSRMFSLQVAFLASILYIINPQIWLQAEKTLSDAFGLFFVVTFTYFFYRAIEPILDFGMRNADYEFKNPKSQIPNPQSGTWLFLGSITLGLGIGVRISYMAFIITWGFIIFIVCKRTSIKKSIFAGFGGLGLGVIVWFGYLLWKFGAVNYFNKFTSHSRYHFIEEGYSIIGSTDNIGRLMTILKNIVAHSLGAYWTDTPLLRILPTIVMIIAIVAYIIKEKFDLKNRFLSISIGSYIIWLVVVQTAIRQTMVLAPFFIILISAGIFYFINDRKTEKYQRVWLLPVILLFIIVPMSFDSGRLVWINRETKPPQVALVDYVANNYDKDTSKFYCLNTWRLFQYYAPEWRDDQNRHVYFTPKISNAERNLKDGRHKLEHVFVSSKLHGRHKYKDRLRSVKLFERDNYAVAEYNSLALYEFDTKRLYAADKRLGDGASASVLTTIFTSLANIQNANNIKRKED